MGTSRTWVESAGRRRWLDARETVLLLALAIAVFACFFAIGHAASPGGAPSEGALAGLPISSPETSIPLQLGGAPPIAIAVAPTPRRTPVPATAGPASGIARAAAVAGPPVAATPPASRTPATPQIVRAPVAPTRPTPTPTPAPAVKPAPAAVRAPTRVTPASTGRGSSGSGAGKSFDTSQ